MWWIYITGIWTVPVFYSIKKFGSGIYVVSHRSWIKLKKNSSFVRDDLQYISTKEIYQNQNHGSRLLILKYSTQQHPFAILGTKVLRLISLAQTFCLRQDLFQSTSTVHNIYRPQTKFAKVMFSQMSVCPQWGEYLGRYPPWVGLPPGRYTPWAGTTPPWQEHPLGRQPPRQVHPRDRYTTSRYTPWQVHHPSDRYTPTHSACWDTVNKRAVRIPLECIRVSVCYLSTIHILLIANHRYAAETANRVFSKFDLANWTNWPNQAKCKEETLSRNLTTYICSKWKASLMKNRPWWKKGG